MCSGVTTAQKSYTMTSNLTEMVSPTSITQRSAAGGVKLRGGGQSTTVSDDELEATSVTYSQMSERMKSDRVPLTKPEEDHRRRTIIVEKKNGSYGFTLQSYGIHYKKVQEVEMITYVDYVEYDGPAYKAGMREGDVILSINGTDMEKSDHKTLVNFIKECDSYMRMVVLFEDCVRKVGLHMRYIQLHNILQNKMAELERICIRENELLHGKWKTHSLPARKKASSSPVESEGVVSPSDKEAKPLENVRPTLSTENVNVGKPKTTIIPPPAQFMLAYHYLDPNCRYILRPSTSSSSGEYLVSIGPPSRSHSEYQSFVQKTGSNENNSMQSIPGLGTPANPSPKNSFATPNSQSQQNIHQAQQQEQGNMDMQARLQAEQHQMKINRNVNGHFCNPCIRHSNKEKKENVDKDNVSLDAYDLASPCCEPQCVPTKRRVRHKEHHHKHKHRENKDRPQRPKSQSHIPPTPPNQRQSHPEKHVHTHRSRYFDLSSGLASHCSLHSCTSSEYGGVPAENSGASYSTSLSTDTLYWEPQSENSGGVTAARPPSSSVKSNNARHNYQHQFIQRYYPHAAQIQPAPPQGYHQHFVHKPKSWDNLTTKSFGGYGFGYGYLDTVGPKLTNIQKLSSQQQQSIPTQQQQQQQPTLQQQRNSVPRKTSFVRYSQYGEVENYAPPPTQFVHQITTTTMTTITAKSTENLIDPTSDSNNIICDCLETSNHQTVTPVIQPTQQSLKSIENREYYQPGMRINTNLNNNNNNNSNNNNNNSNNNSNNNNVVSTGTSTIINSRNVATTSEITRL